MTRIAPALGLALCLFSTAVALAQPRVAGAADEPRPPLAFREDFTDGAGETPVTMASIKNKELRFALYGPGKDHVSKTYHAKPPNEGGFIWSGDCTEICGFSLYLPNDYLDLRGQAKITWRTEQTGFHQLRLMIKLADGTMYVGDQAVGASTDWQVSELIIKDLRWRELDAKVMNDSSSARGAGPWAAPPDLSKVAEIGWTDLQAGSGHGTMGGSSRVDWIEVYAKRTPRK